MYCLANPGNTRKIPKQKLNANGATTFFLQISETTFRIFFDFLKDIDSNRKTNAQSTTKKKESRFQLPSLEEQRIVSTVLFTNFIIGIYPNSAAVLCHNGPGGGNVLIFFLDFSHME